jgi:purine-nucleoside/S-methyl-5'-thioadenosine phosphorylase / adenosine deaminase
MTDLSWIEPDWPAPPNVRAVSTLRTGGVSTRPYASLNLGAHVGDDLAAVERNRALLCKAIGLATQPLWLSQVHGTDVVDVVSQAMAPTADGAFALRSGRACTILTADCLPVLFCDRDGSRVAAAHAGWRGLVGGVLSRTIDALAIPASRLIAWLGPAIEQDAFEVGVEVRNQFIARDAGHAAAFVANERGRWQADLYGLAQRELERSGVSGIYGGGERCYEDAARFFSYRRDGRTGRMATLIWLAQ